MLDFFDKTARKGTILTRKGYIIKKKDFSEKEILKIKNQLTVKPVVHRDFAHFAEEFPVFYESSDKLYLPRYWGLENLGPPKKIDICDGEPINLKCVFEPRPIQRPIIKRALSILQNPFDKFIVKSVKNKKSIVKHKLYGGGTIISIPCGLGKCVGKDTPILMYDGKIKMVQDVKVGDKLMGDDSKHRNVLSICNGKEQLYKIIPKRGNPYIVNESHILSLKCSRKCRFGDKNNTFDIPLKEYLNLPKSYHGKGSPICGYKVSVEFPEKEVDMEPYALGYWLGDGTSGDAQITTQDDEVVEYFQKYIKQLGGYVHQGKDSAKCRHSLHYSFRKCEFKNYLRKYNLLKNKHIPHIYKCNSRENRLKLLAGLLDSDGYHYHNMYSITQKNEQLLDDIVYLCLSLGFYAHKREVWKSCTNGKNKEKRLYYTTTIGGYGLEEIPVIIDRKKCQPRKQIKNPLHSLITVEKLEVGDYYGFQIDGNRRFLLGDFTVTHNTFCALYIMTKLAQKTLIVVHTSVLLTQWIERIEQFVPGARVGIIKGPKCDVEDKDIVIAMLQTLVSENRVFPRGFFDQFGLSVVDECFPFNTSIITENGYSLIGTLYEMWVKGKEIPKILSYNQLTKNFEYKSLTHAWRKERTDLVEIKCSKKIMKCTPEHKILTSHGYMKAKDLTEGDLLISYYDANENTDFNYISQGLNEDQEQILLGSFLGDGCIRRINGKNRIRLSIIHGKKQYDYCKWKANMFGIKELNYIEKNGYSQKEAFRFHTKIIDIDKKYIFPKTAYTCPQWVLDKLDPRGLSIWFLDDGSINQRGNGGHLSTHSFDYDSQIRIIETLNNVFDIPCCLSFDNRKKGYHYIRFNKDGIIKLKQIISPYISIDNMLYKIHDDIQEWRYSWDSKFLDYGYARVNYVKSYIHKGNNRQTKPYVYDIEVKDNHNFVVCGTKSGNPHQGIVVSNCHHLGAPTFSRALPIVATKYFLGLSATPTRNDKLEKVFYWHLGYIGNDLIEKRGGQEVIVKFINYTNTHFREIRRYNARTCRNDAYDIPKMVDLIISCKRRLKFIRFQLKLFAQQGRQILVLSSRKIHLKSMKENFDSFNYTKIVDGEEVPITTGYYMGGMKKAQLEESSKCDVIYGTYNLVAEGTDIPTLNTLLMACPRKEVEQVVGRILRANTGFTPIVIDIADNFSIFINQGTYRQRFYKRQEYHIDVFDVVKENYKDIKLKDIKQTEGLKIRKRKKVQEIVFSGLAICSDSDD